MLAVPSPSFPMARGSASEQHLPRRRAQLPFSSLNSPSLRLLAGRFGFFSHRAEPSATTAVFLFCQPHLLPSWHIQSKPRAR